MCDNLSKQATMLKQAPPRSFLKGRYIVVIAILMLIGLIMTGRVLYLDTLRQPFLLGKNTYESVHYRDVSAHRGVIFDRNGIPLAISAPVDNIIFDPKLLRQQPPADWQKLANITAIGMSDDEIQALLKTHPNNRYYIVQRNVPPQQADAVQALNINGVYIEHNSQSYYPFGAAAAQLVGFTNLQDVGQDGLELSYNNQLQGLSGRYEITTSAIGQLLHIDQWLQHPHLGRNLTLSIDSRIQFYAYQALKYQVTETKAKSGSVVVLDPKTGEVLAAVSYPSFNPNSFDDRCGPGVRDRALTDQFEPGSTVKVLTLAAALTSGKYTPQTEVDTSPGYYFIGRNRVRDDANYGTLTLTGILTKSSNVGVSKVALSLPAKSVYDMFVKAGVGQSPTGHFPGEASGVLHPFDHLGKFTFATMTFGYAISMSLLQLAHVYAGIANNGLMMPLSFIKAQNTHAKAVRLMSPEVAQQLLAMLHTVVGPGGTGLLANIPGYGVAGKTGTAHQVGPHGFYKNHYNAVFVGVVPYPDPRLVIAVRINDPKGHFNSFGGISAAPVFASVAARSMQALGVAPTKSVIDYKLFKNQAELLRAIAQA